MSALEQKERYQVVCYGDTTNYWFTNQEEEARLVFEVMLQYLRKQYHKITIAEWDMGTYIVLNEVCALGRKK